MRWHSFSKYSGNSEEPPFERFFKLFREIITHTSGDLPEALEWMTEIDREYKLSNSNYGIGDFIKDLKEKGFLDENPVEGTIQISGKMEQSIRQGALNEIFGKIKKSNKGDHSSNITGIGDELSADQRPFNFGDDIDTISITDSIRNATGLFSDSQMGIRENDLIVNERELKAQSSTVLMIDISHSMILYGEDRITPAKKVAMALAELIRTRYPKDTLDIITFGNDAKRIELKELPYLQVGPYHTNTVAGLQLAQDILRRRKNRNKQIFMITDGKPSCLKEGDGYYMNSFGLDRKIVNKTLNEAAICRRLKIPITTFMIARDPYLQSFVEEFTETNNGKAFYTNLNGLGDFLFKDFENNKRKHL
ncbi:MAG: VWA domain-containing protein [Bacteroidia bacterium]|nr:VWA domain-containing protein [Bacteroidia bacterium]